MSDEARRAAAVLDFVNRYLDDVAQGQVRSLSDYQADYPDCQTAIAAEFAQLHAIASRHPAPASAVGRVIGTYRVERELGSGGQAVVFLARDLRLPRQVALKVLRATHLAGAQQAQARFQREAAVVSRLDHPGIGTVYETGVAEDCAYIAMRYVEGGSLADKIAAHVRPGSGRPGSVVALPTARSAEPRARLDAALALLEAVARALHTAHTAGVVHRDVKPSNILLTATGEPVLVDFGLALDAGEEGAALTQSGTQFGTPAYMAPEQIQGDGARPDWRVDVYGLGVSAFELLTGRRPFEAATRDDLYRRILGGRLPDPCQYNRDLPRELRTVLLTAMAPERERRYQSAADFADDLLRVRTFQPIRAEPPTWHLRMRRWVQRNPFAALLIAALALGLCITSWAVWAMLRARAEADAVAFRLDAATLEGLRHDLEESLWPERPALLPELREWLAIAERFAADCRRRHGAPRGNATAVQRALAEFTTAPDGAIPHAKQRIAHIERAIAATAVPTWQMVRDDLRARGLGAVLPRPVYGMEPLARDPHSGCWEFWHVRSGARPEAVQGRWRITAETGAVFVLLVGGTARVGAQSERPDLPNYCTGAEVDEMPVHEVELAPFLIAKYELTQGQWLRLTRGNPSRYAAGAVLAPDAGSVSLAHPVESLRWGEAGLWLERFGMQLPSEVQWEYAARAGLSASFWTGDDEAKLLGVANLGDRSLQRLRPESSVEWEFEDGYPLHAPVDDFRPNPFGLVGTVGNVAEWCRDAMVSYLAPAQAGDGFRPGGDPDERIARGGAFLSGARRARVSYRVRESGRNALPWIGVRPVIALSPFPE